MGIRGLSSFITQHPDITKPFKLHDTTVIVDGKNLIHSLYENYKLDFRYGGEYEQYYDCVRMFMSSFLECNIKPIVVLDGGHEKTERKLNSSIERCQKTLDRVQSIARGEVCPYSILPSLANKVFHSVLFDLGIQLANSDYAADDQVAVLGNYYKCPVISNDSDFYIFDVHKGFIHLDSIDVAIDIEVGSDGKEYKFLNCKIYYIEEFVNAFPGLDKNMLPLFGTLNGSEFVEPKTFDNFFSNIRLPEYKGRQLSFDLRHRKNKKMVGILCWLRHKTLNEAVNVVASYFKREEQEYIKSIIDVSVCGYKLNPCSLTFIFDQNLNDPRNDLLSKTMLITPCGKKLPQNSVLKFHQVQLPSFFINVIVTHRVFLHVKVQDMEMESSHSCSSYIRRILYGILVRHDINGTECKNLECLGCIEEYDRQGSSIEKKQVLPLFELEGIGLLPKVDEVHCLAEKKCNAIITKVLGVGSDFFLGIPDAWQLFIGTINYWLRISGCRSEAFVSAVILNLIYFGLIKCKSPFLNQKRCPKKMPTRNKCACSSITCIAANVSESDLKYAGKVLEDYYTNPTLKPDRRLFLNVVHSYSQIQSCLKHITYLNQLFNEYFKNPAPHKCFSGIMLYNLTEAIVPCPIAKLFIGKMLGKDLNLLFSHLKSKVCENVPNFDASRKTGPVRYTLPKGKQRCSHTSFK